MYYYTTTSSASSAAESAAASGIWAIIALVLSIVGGILVYFLFVKSNRELKGKFLNWLRDFLAFKVMWIEAILKVIYYIATIWCVLGSFSLIAVHPLAWLAMLVLGPIGIRLAYEMMMMFIMVWRNTKDIADNTKRA